MSISPNPSNALGTRRATSERVDADIGSNNWVVAPQRTDTGRPILANDPHRGHAVPSLRYAAQLVAPGLNVIGAGEPALPGISIGHNERIAFGLTIFPIDQEDLYVYETRPDAPNEYRYRDRLGADDDRRRVCRGTRRIAEPVTSSSRDMDR